MEIWGIKVSTGIEIGKAYLYSDYEYVPVRKKQISGDEVGKEVSRFRQAVDDATDDIRGLHHSIAEELGENQAKIIEAQLLFLEDKYLVEKTIEKIRSEKLNAAFAFSKVIEETVNTFSSIGISYLRGRVEDIRYVGRQVLKNLAGGDYGISISDIREKVIVVAHDLSPADTAMMNKENIIAFVTDMGSRTSHTAIMARSIEIPAVVGLKNITGIVKNGDILVVDGNTGVVQVNPSPAVLERYREKKRAHLDFERELGEIAKLPGQTLDGHEIKLMANIELPSELETVISHGADGIGLYRTEFLYLNRKDLPDEQEQYEAYKKVISEAAPGRVIIRTVDLGGDKFVSNLKMPEEVNPFLGWRGIRFCLEQPEMFKVQLRAILRAGVEGRAGVMFPLVSCMEELVKAKEYLEETKSELRQAGADFAENIEIGVMIETPSAAMTADMLAERVDFFSIGTNDLIQYSMAVDRVNEKVAHLYRPTHPGILRLVKNIIESGHSKGIRVDMCGEMAGEEQFVMVLLGMGIDGLSMSPVAIPRAKKLVRSITYDSAKSFAEKVLKMSSADEVEEAIKSLGSSTGAAGTPV